MKPKILFLGPQADWTLILSTFDKAAGLFRSLLEVHLRTPDSVTEGELQSAKRILCFEDAVRQQFASRPIQMWTLDTLEARVTQLVAELMGGGAALIDAPNAKPRIGKPKSVGTVKLSRETAGRRGKGVTVVSELKLNDEALKDLATKLKSKVGSGGTAKDGRIEIQGDHRDVLQTELERLGYQVKRSGG